MQMTEGSHLTSWARSIPALDMLVVLLYAQQLDHAVKFFGDLAEALSWGTCKCNVVQASVVTRLANMDLDSLQTQASTRLWSQGPHSFQRFRLYGVGNAASPYDTAGHRPINQSQAVVLSMSPSHGLPCQQAVHACDEDMQAVFSQVPVKSSCSPGDSISGRSNPDQT